MRVRQFQQSCVYSTGLLLAALTIDCRVSQAQTVQPNSAASGIALIEAASFIDLPSTVLDEETSPSDSAKPANEAKEKSDSSDTTKDKSDKDKAGDKSTASEKDASNKKDDAAKKKDSRDAIAPMQNRELTIRVQAVSIAHDKIGTGLVPKADSARSTEQVPLPTGAARGMYHTHVYWCASQIQHFPLYFEDAMLERHGHTRCFLGSECAQSMISGAKFFATIPVLPYLETLRPKHDCVYALGHYRPGSGAPCLRDNIPYDAKAAVVESASAAVFFWAVPL